jgi:fluoride exporter
VSHLPAWFPVWLGGGLGAALRHVLAARLSAAPWPEKALAGPWAIFVVNTLGCLAFGLLHGWAKAKPEPTTALFFLTGTLGGFTTFSTFAWDTHQLAQQGRWGWAAANTGASVLAGLLAVALGLKLTGK